MGLPSGTFTNASSGRLQVVFHANYYTNSGNDWGTGALELLLRGYVGSGAGLRTVVMGINNHSGVVEVPYVGGTSLPVGMQYLTHSFSGPSTIGANELRIVCRLFRV